LVAFTYIRKQSAKAGAVSSQDRTRYAFIHKLFVKRTIESLALCFDALIRCRTTQIKNPCHTTLRVAHKIPIGL